MGKRGEGTWEMGISLISFFFFKLILIVWMLRYLKMMDEIKNLENRKRLKWGIMLISTNNV